MVESALETRKALFSTVIQVVKGLVQTRNGNLKELTVEESEKYGAPSKKVGGSAQKSGGFLSNNYKGSLLLSAMNPSGNITKFLINLISALKRP